MFWEEYNPGTEVHVEVEGKMEEEKEMKDEVIHPRDEQAVIEEYK